MSNNDRNLDLNFLRTDEADLIRCVLERDKQLKKREEERLRKLRETQRVRQVLSLGSQQEAKDRQSSVKQQTLGSRIKGKSFAELTDRPQGLLGKQRDDQNGTGHLKGTSLRSRISSLFSFRFPQQKAEVRQASVVEGFRDDGRVPPVSTVRPGSGVGEHTKVSWEVAPDKVETPSLGRDQFHSGEDRGQPKETATGKEEPASLKTKGWTELGLNDPGHKASVIPAESNLKSLGNPEAGTPILLHSRNGGPLPSPLPLDDKPPSSVSHQQSATMLSSALTTVLAQPWSSRFRKSKADSGPGKEAEDLKQEVGDWSRFLRPCRPFTGEAGGSPGDNNNNATTPTSHQLPGSNEQQVRDSNIYPGSDCKDGTPTGSGIALPPTPPETPSINSARSVDYHFFQKESQPGSRGFISPRIRDRASQHNSKPTTSSLLLSLRRLNSAKGSPYLSSTLTDTPPPSPGSSVQPTTGSISQERALMPAERSRSLPIQDESSPLSPGRPGNRVLMNWRELLKRNNPVLSSDWKKSIQQDNAPVIPSHTATNTRNDMTGTNLNQFSVNNTPIDTNHNILSPNGNVTSPSGIVSGTSHNILGTDNTISNTSTIFGPDHSLNRRRTYNRTLGFLNTYNIHKTRLSSSTTPVSPNTLNTNKNLNNPDAINSAKAPDFNSLKCSDSPRTSFYSNTSISTYTPCSPSIPVTPDTISSPNTPLSQVAPISSDIPVGVSIPSTQDTTRSPHSLSTLLHPRTPSSSSTPVDPNSPKSPNTSLSPKAPMNTNTLISSDTSITPDSMGKKQFSHKTLISMNTSVTSNTLAPADGIRSSNAPFGPETTVSPSTPLSSKASIIPDGIRSQNNALSHRPSISPFTPLSSNTPATPDGIRSPNAQFSHQTSISPYTPLSSNTSATPDGIRSPNAQFSHQTSISPYTPPSSNTPATPDSIRSPNAQFSHQTSISPYTPLSSNTPATPDGIRSPNTPFDPLTSMSPDTSFSSNTSYAPYIVSSVDTSVCQGTPSSTTLNRIRSPSTSSALVSPDIYRSTHMPISPNTPNSIVKSHSTSRTPICPDTVLSANAFEKLNSPRKLESYKNLADGCVGADDGAGVSTVNAPNTSTIPKQESSPSYDCSFQRDPWLFSSRTEPMEDQAKPILPITPSNAQPEVVTSSSAGDGKPGPEALCLPISPTNHSSLGRTLPITEKPPIFSSPRTVSLSERHGVRIPPSPCLSSTDLDQTATPWRSHFSQSHNPISRFTFDNAWEPLSVRSLSRAPLRKTRTPSLSSAYPRYCRNLELQASNPAALHGPQSFDRSSAVPMDTSGNITSPQPSESLSVMRETSQLPGQAAVTMSLCPQPQSNTPARHKTSQDMLTFEPMPNHQPSASDVAVNTEMGTDGTFQLSASQPSKTKPQILLDYGLANTDDSHQSLTNSIGSPTNQDSERTKGRPPTYAHSLTPPRVCVPAARRLTSHGTDRKGIMVNKDFESMVDKSNSAVSLKQKSNNRLLPVFRSGNSNLSPPVSGKESHPVAPKCDRPGKATGEDNEAPTFKVGQATRKVGQVPSQIKRAKRSDESLAARKKSNSMLDLFSFSQESERAGGPGRWQGTRVLRPLNRENETGKNQLRDQQEAQIMHLPAKSTQPEPVRDSTLQDLKKGNRNHSYKSGYATVPGRPGSQSKWHSLDFNPEDVENENVFYSASMDPAHLSNQRKKSTSVLELRDVRRTSVTQDNDPWVPRTIHQESVFSPSPNRAFGLHHGRSFSVSSVHSSRPSGCGRISRGPKLGSCLDLRSASIDGTSLGSMAQNFGFRQRETRSFSASLGQNVTLEKSSAPGQLELPPSSLAPPVESTRPSRRISSSSTTSRTSQDTPSPRSRGPSVGYRSSLSACEESGSDSETTTDDEYYLSPDRGERETEL